MGTLTSQKAQDRLSVGYALDHLWSETMGLPEGDSKEHPLRLVAQLLERESVPYALIGGVAVQLHSEEPRSTLDIDVAIPTYAQVPRTALLEEHPEMASSALRDRLHRIRTGILGGASDSDAPVGSK